MASTIVSRLDESFERIAWIVFEETRQSRRQLHLVRGALVCDAVFELSGGFHISGDCPCVEEYVDAVCSVWQYLRDLAPETVRSYGALARTHCRLRLVRDIQRRRRGRQSQQRTDRLATGPIGRALATEEQRALLADVVAEAGSAAPLDGDAQLHVRLAWLRAARLGGDPDEHVVGVVRDLSDVRAAAIEHGGRRRDSDGRLVSWWEFYVERGLGQRERLSVVPISTMRTSGDPVVDIEDQSAAAAMERVDDEERMVTVTGVRADDDPDTALAHFIARAVRDGRGGTDGRAVHDLLLRMVEHGMLSRLRMKSIVDETGKIQQIREAARRVRIAR